MNLRANRWSDLVIFGFPFASIRGFLQPFFILGDGEEVFPLLALRDLSWRLMWLKPENGGTTHPDDWCHEFTQELWDLQYCGEETIQEVNDQPFDVGTIVIL